MEKQIRQIKASRLEKGEWSECEIKSAVESDDFFKDVAELNGYNSDPEFNVTLDVDRETFARFYCQLSDVSATLPWLVIVDSENCIDLILADVQGMIDLLDKFARISSHLRKESLMVELGFGKYVNRNHLMQVKLLRGGGCRVYVQEGEELADYILDHVPYGVKELLG